MISKNKIDKSFNFKGLPCIYLGDKYVLFDPYSIKSASFENTNLLDTKSCLEKLEENGFKLYSSFPKYDIPKNEKHFTFILTTDCNLACKYCYTQSKTKKLYLSETIAKKIIDSEIPNNYKGDLFIQFFGGEPTLNFKTLKIIIKEIKKKHSNPFFYITTNGIISEPILDFLFENNVAFYLSLDGLKKYNDINRIGFKGESSFDKVLETLKKIKTANIPVKVRATITPETVEGMPVFAKLIFELGIKLIHFTPYAEVGYAIGRSNNICSEEFQNSFVEKLNQSFDIAKQYNAKILTPITLALKKKPKPYCKIFHDDTKIIITPEGKRTLCYGIHGEFNDYSEQFLYADFNTDIMKFEHNTSIKEDIKKSYKSATENICNNCFAQFMCNGGCFVENLISNNDMQTPSTNFCNMQRKIAYLLISRILNNN